MPPSSMVAADSSTVGFVLHLVTSVLIGIGSAPALWVLTVLLALIVPILLAP